MILPAGTYFFGDPCYVFPNNENGSAFWSKICDKVGSFHGVETVDIGTDSEFLVALGCTAYGDGLYNDQFGHTYPVDAGLIGLVNLEQAAKYFVPDMKASDGRVFTSKGLVNFEMPSIGVFTLSYDDTTLVIDTSFADGDDEDESEDDC